MQIHSNKPNYFFKKIKKFLFNKSGGIIFLIGISCFIFIASLNTYQYLYATRYLQRIYGIVNSTIHTHIHTIPNYIKGHLVKKDNIVIDIKAKHLLQLSNIRKNKIQNHINGLTTKNEAAPFPALITYKNKTYHVKLNLIGQSLAHTQSKSKWSFKVKIKNNEFLFGMKEFKLIIPHSRSGEMNNPVTEWVAHQFQKKENLITPYYEFVNVNLNGKDLGIYAIEETFTKYLVESNKRREGIIIKIEHNLHQNRKIYKESTVNKTPKLLQQKHLFTILWKSFTFGKMSFSDLFNVDEMAIHLVISDLVYGHHSIKNSVYYFNPISRKLEPIGREFDISNNPKNLDTLIITNTYKHTPLLQKLFTDEKMIKAYAKHLFRMTSKDYLDNFINNIDADTQKNIHTLYKNYPTFTYNYNYIYENAQKIRDALFPENEALLSYLNSSPGKTILDITNAHKLPIELIGVYQNEQAIKSIDQTLLGIYSAKKNKISIKLPDEIKNNVMSLTVLYKILGSNKVFSSPIFPWTLSNEKKVLSNPVTATKAITSFPFYEKTEGNTIYFKEGHWTAQDPIIIPEHYNLVVQGPFSLNLIKKSILLSYSPVSLNGFKHRPIHIFSSDNTGQGLVVLNASSPSKISYSTFTSLSTPKHMGWETTGSVTFYKSPVTINNSTFQKNHSEDALNIVSSPFKLIDVTFTKTSGDALDADFSNGHIIRNKFTQSGNDSIDVSGSKVTIEETTIDQAGDKGISAGENSHLTVIKTHITNSIIGIASKDSSHVSVKDSSISYCDTCLAAYQKKPEFTQPSSIKVTSSKINNCTNKNLLKNKSTIIIANTPLINK